MTNSFPFYQRHQPIPTDESRSIFTSTVQAIRGLNSEHGEYIYNPEDEPERYNILRPRDLAVFEFQGRILPTSAKMVMVSQIVPADRVIHESLTTLLGDGSMLALTIAQVQAIANRLEDDEHPFHELTFDVDLGDAAFGGSRGITALNRPPLRRAVSRYELERSRRAAEDVGRMGEEFVLQHLLRLKAAGAILDFTWTSDANAVAPYDFLAVLPDRQEIAIAVKSTGGEFERPIHASSAELVEMTGTRRYDIYRVFELSETSGVLRIAERVGDLASVVLETFAPLPAGVEVDGVSLDVSVLTFGPPIPLTPPTTEEIGPIG